MTQISLANAHLRVGLYFEPRGSANAPEGPGWYLYATRQNEEGHLAEIVPRVRLSSDEAIKFCKVVDNFSSGKPMNWSDAPNAVREDISVEQAAIDANEAGREVIRRELAYAEEAVQKLDALRRRAKEFGIEDES